MLSWLKKATINWLSLGSQLAHTLASTDDVQGGDTISVDMKHAVPIPQRPTGIGLKRMRGYEYVYWNTGNVYNREKMKTISHTVSIGKTVPGSDNMMYPNDNFKKYFPEEAKVAEDALMEAEEALEEAAEEANKGYGTFVYEASSCFVGTHILFEKIVSELHLDKILEKVFGNDSKFILDLATFQIIEESNEGWEYPAYAGRHAIFTDGMRAYGDSYVSKFLEKRISEDQILLFLQLWNKERDHDKKIYVSYDSTNMNCQSGEVEMCEYGAAKDDSSKEIIPFAIAYDLTDRLPLMYEIYSGSINDVSQVEMTIEKMHQYYYNNLAFIIDRGYFSKRNIKFFDEKHYGFIIMVKGYKKLVRELVKQVRGTFELDQNHFIKKYDLYGITVEHPLTDDENDKKNRYFHIYYSPYQFGCEHDKLMNKIDRYERTLTRNISKDYSPTKEMVKYFNITYDIGDPECIAAISRKTAVIEDELRYNGYFVLISSEEPSALRAITLYKSRDISEKLFRAEKSYLGNITMKGHTTECVEAKYFISFIALIIRNEFYTKLQDLAIKEGIAGNFMTVQGAKFELQRIELVRNEYFEYHLDRALTKKAKLIFKAIGLSYTDVRNKINELCNELNKLARNDKRKSISNKAKQGHAN